MGRETATALTEYLDTLATKKDLDEMVATLATKHELTAGLSDLELRMYRTMLSGTLVLVTTNVALWGSAVALLR